MKGDGSYVTAEGRPAYARLRSPPSVPLLPFISPAPSRSQAPAFPQNLSFFHAFIYIGSGLYLKKQLRIMLKGENNV